MSGPAVASIVEIEGRRGGRARSVGLNALFWAVTGLAIALPTLVVAWTERKV